MPDVKGRGTVAKLIAKYFPPPLDDAIVWTSMRLGHQILVDLRSETELVAYYTGDYESKLIKAALKLIRPDSVVLDVGANIGLWTVPLARALSPAGCLHAFEPIPQNFARLEKNIGGNDIRAVVQLHRIGLSDTQASISMALREDFQNGAETGNASIVINSNDGRFPWVDIAVVPLDGDLFHSLKIDRIDFIKIDIEGHEDKFLSGAMNILQRFRPIIFLEINDYYYHQRHIDPSEVFGNLMRKLNYAAALERSGRWRLDGIQNRDRDFANIFYLPAERANDLIRILNT